MVGPNRVRQFHRSCVQGSPLPRHHRRELEGPCCLLHQLTAATFASVPDPLRRRAVDEDSNLEQPQTVNLTTRLRQNRGRSDP